MHQLLTLILFIILSFYNLYAQTTTTEWQLIQQTESIEVYTRPSNHSSVKEVRIKAIFATNIDTFMNVLEDVSRYQEWVYKCATSLRLQTENERAFYYYAVTDMPFPVIDRDLVIYSTTTKNSATGSFTIHSVAVGAAQYQYPLQNNKIRIPFFESSWRIAPQGDHQVMIDYQVATEPGGNIPYWIINMGITIGPVRTMQALQKILEK